VSLAHTENGAVAIAATVPVGIDLEPIDRDARAILPSFATVEERELMDAVATDYFGETAPTRLWCAKEAVAKALGTGLQGRPRDFEALAIEANGDFLMQHGPSGSRLVAHTLTVGAFILAYSIVPEEEMSWADHEVACAQDGRTDA
jgi:phosphopantetheinyl transferase